jgi:UDP-N-acetylmuramoyl-tripeptide--D-alanyl-D-alanine ligase
MVSIDKLYNLFLQSTGISTDTRTVSKGNLFFCLKGENFNGNRFAKEALEKEASFVIVDEKEYQFNDQCILVEDTLEILQKLAYFHRQKLSIPILGITGTNGKTTTKELVYAVLSERYNVYATKGNLNNHIGVPLTLLSIDSNNAEIAIVEMGANHPGEIEELCQIAQPDYGIITNIGKAHLEGFKTIDGVIQTKKALYDAIKERDGTVFVNADDELLMSLSKDMNRITYVRNGDYKGELLSGNLYVTFNISDYSINVQTRLTGDYNFSNAMAAVAVGLHFDIPIENIKLALESYAPDNNRSQIVQRENKTIIIDAYNANPSSMQAAIENLKQISSPYKAVLLGDMFELGNDSLAEHQKIVDMLKNSDIKQVYLLGEAFSKTDADTSWKYTDYDFLANILKQQLPDSVTILIKGSRSMKMERFLDILK